MQILNEKLKQDIRPYVFQSALATVCVLLILLVLDVLTHTAIIATLGSSAFLVFTRPRAYASRLRPLLGGYLIGISVGVCFYLLSMLTQAISLPISLSTIYIFYAALAVGGAIFMMVATSTEHPPAAGMALGLVMNQWNSADLLFILSAVLGMALLRKLLQPVMVDLI